MVYSRESDDGTALSFSNSGKLWNDALVLMDRETGTLFSQASGEALSGENAGRTLNRIPSRLTTWEEWRKAHPDTRVLVSDRKRRGLRYRMYPRTNLMLGVLGSANPDDRLPGKTLVAGFAAADPPLAVAFDRRFDGVQLARVVTDDGPLIVELTPADGRPQAWRSSGPPDWSKKELVPTSSMYWFVWASLHPGSRIVLAKKQR